MLKMPSTAAMLKLLSILTLVFFVPGILSETPPKWIETLSWEPRAFLYHNFLTQEECDHLVSTAGPTIARSSVVDAATGGSKLDEIRTSYGTFIRKGHDEIITSIEERIAHWTKVPVENGEDLQVLRYENGQKYDNHWDWFDEDNKHNPGGAGNRIATVLMYLSDVEEGGETALPHGTWSNEKVQRRGPYTECADSGVAVKPSKGDALLFWNLDVASKEGDKYSLHAGCPVLKGIKWSATKWIHVRQFGAPPEDPACRDEHEECESWSDIGECDRNPKFMLTSCRKSCAECKR